MALDQYSICPCGSGKKIKFCKCADNLQEMLKVERMIEGEQSIAALDRINQLMKTFPTDAWLHAMKCELLLRLREMEPLEEASAKFVRLRPDNPLAQLYRALLAVMRGNLEEATALFMEAVANTGDNYHPLLPSVALNIVTFVARFRNSLPALLHCEYLLDLLGESPQIEQFYQSLVSSEVNLLTREAIPSPSEPEDAPWLERYREAYGMLAGYRIPQAKTKLEALQREFGPEPEILIALLHCKLLMIDLEGAAALCKKLAENTAIGLAQRVFFQALCCELDAEGSGILQEDELCEYILENESDVETKLLASKLVIATEGNETRQAIVEILGEEVPPKHACIAVRPILQDKYPEVNPRANGVFVAFFGRQTDKPPRLVVIEPKEGPWVDYYNQLRSELGLTNRKVLRSSGTIYENRIGLQVSIDKPVEADKQDDFEKDLKNLMKQQFKECRFKLLNNLTPAEATSKPELAIPLQALLLHWQAMGRNSLWSNDFRELYQELGVEQPNVDPSDDTFDLVGGAAYFWTDLTNIDAESLIRLMQSAMTRNVQGAYADYVAKSKAIQWDDELKGAAEYTTLNMEVRVTRNLETVAELLEKIYESGKKIGVPVGNAVLERVEVLNHLRRDNDAMVFLQKAFREVPNDPYLRQYMEMVRYQMQQQQMQRGEVNLEGALLRHGNEKTSAGGLWTPDQPSPPPASASEDAPSSGSKLWLPGQ